MAGYIQIEGGKILDNQSSRGVNALSLTSPECNGWDVVNALSLFGKRNMFNPI